MEPADVGLIAIILLLIGGTISILLTSAARRNERRKHHRLSTSSREKNTRYDLFEEPQASDPKRTRARGSRRNHKPTPVIDILKRDPSDEN